MQGRKPTPRTLKVVTGNPGHRPLPDSQSLGFVVEIPPAPAHRGELARAEWDRITPNLEAAALISPLYMTALATYCDAWGDYLHARNQLARPAAEGGGWLVKTPNDYEVQSPWVALMKNAFDRLTRMEIEFGLTASARARVESNQQPGLFDDDPMEAFLRAGRKEA